MSGVNWTEEQLRAHIGSQFVGTTKPLAQLEPKQRGSRMNKWEAEYDAELRVKWGAGVIQWYGFEAIKLRLADSTYYTPDFAVMDAGKLEFHEVKGFWREDALVKFKVAAEKFPFLFLALRKRKVCEGGGWELIRTINRGREVGIVR